MSTKRKFSIKAVIVGWLVDVLGSQIFGGILGVVAGVILVTKGTIDQETMQAYFSNSVWFLTVGFILGLCFTMLGGYLAARIAKFAELKHALGVGILSLVTGSLFVLLTGANPGSTWLLLAALILTVPAALLGGYLRMVTAKGKEPSTEAPE
ncbi:hypothetical protein ACFL5K_01305 [Gemmatimonadota bacterium]